MLSNPAEGTVPAAGGYCQRYAGFGKMGRKGVLILPVWCILLHVFAVIPGCIAIDIIPGVIYQKSQMI